MPKPELEILGGEATALEGDLQREDARPAVAIRGYRAALTAASNAGQQLPVVPSSIKQLQHEKDVLIKVHLILLESKLGPETSARLDDYVSHEIAPHITSNPIGAHREHDPEKTPLPPFVVQ